MSEGSGDVHLVVPGALEQRTGGYLYDARMARGLERRGWRVVVHGLEGAFPEGDALAAASLERALRSLPDGARVLLDGLALGALPGPLRAHAPRLRALALVHHPLAEETGLPAAERERLSALERDALGACAGVIVTSAFTRGRLLAWGVPLQRVRVVLPGTDAAPAAVGPGPGEPPLLVTVGSVIPRKGQDVLVEALSGLLDVPWTCVAAGSLERAPAFAAEVARRVEGSGLAGRVRFAGELAAEELAALYHRASLFVLASHYEGYGMALAEALARGLPVVATTGGAIPETVPSDAALLVGPADAAALAWALRSLLSAEEGARRRAELAEASRRHGLRLPAWDDAAASLEVAIRELTDVG